MISTSLISDRLFSRDDILSAAKIEQMTDHEGHEEHEGDEYVRI